MDEVMTATAETDEIGQPRDLRIFAPAHAPDPAMVHILRFPEAAEAFPPISGGDYVLRGIPVHGCPISEIDIRVFSRDSIDRPISTRRCKA